jgi:hypothetical protein
VLFSSPQPLRTMIVRSMVIHFIENILVKSSL